MMLIAIPNWQDRVSPVFDVAEQILLVHCEKDDTTVRSHLLFHEGQPEMRAQRLIDQKVDVLICGAISSLLENLLIANRVEVIPRVCGDVEEILEAYLDGSIDDRRYAMPGCCGRRVRQRRRKHCKNSRSQ